MQRNRIREEIENYRLPRPAAPAITPAGFVLCPLPLHGQTPQQCWWQQCLYQLAFEQAVAVAQPSLLERDLLGVWN